MPVACTNCLAPLGPGGAKGLCPRCYRHSRRHDGELPVESRRDGSLTAQLPPVHCTPLLLEHTEAGARADGISLAAWIRRACEAAVLRSAAKRLR